MVTTYTVYDLHDPADAEPGLSLRAAATELLICGGHDFSIRPRPGGGFRLHTTPNGRNAAVGQATMRPAPAFSRANNPDVAETEIFQQVIMAGGYGGNRQRALSDSDYAAMILKSRG